MPSASTATDPVHERHQINNELAALNSVSQSLGMFEHDAQARILKALIILHSLEEHMEPGEVLCSAEVPHGTSALKQCSDCGEPIKGLYYIDTARGLKCGDCFDRAAAAQPQSPT